MPINVEETSPRCYRGSICKLKKCAKGTCDLDRIFSFTIQSYLSSVSNVISQLTYCSGEVCCFYGKRKSYSLKAQRFYCSNQRTTVRKIALYTLRQNYSPETICRQNLPRTRGTNPNPFLPATSTSYIGTVVRCPLSFSLPPRLFLYPRAQQERAKFANLRFETRVHSMTIAKLLRIKMGYKCLSWCQTNQT